MGQSPNPDGRPHSLLLRLAVTLLAPALVLAGERIALPGVDLALLTDRLPPDLQRFDPANTSVLALGVMPFVNACLLVELVALVVPRWSALRHGGPGGRAKLARASALLGIVLAAFQGWGVAKMLEATEFMTRAGLLPELLVTATLIAGACCLLLLAQLIDRWGLVGGLALLTAVPPAIAAVHQAAHALFDPEPAPTKVLAATIGGAALAAIATIAMFRLDRAAPARQASDIGERPYREPADVPRATVERVPIPASGVVPLSIASALLMLPATLANVGLPLEGVAATLNRGDTIFLAGYVVLIAASAVGLAYLFNWPARVAALWSHLGGRRTQDQIEASVRSRMGGAVIRTVAFLLALVAIGELTGRFGGVRLAPTVIALATALVLDAVTEWRQRRAMTDLVPIWPEHRPYAIDVARAALAEAGIAMHARGEHQRALLQFYGPYVPVELHVPSKDAERASEVLAEALLPHAADAQALGGKRTKKQKRKAATTVSVPAWGRVLGAVALLCGGALVSMRAGPVVTAPADDEPGPSGPVAAASLEMISVDDQANPFDRMYAAGSDPEQRGAVQTKLDLPEGASLMVENAPDGPGRTLPRPFVRIVPRANESMEAARARFLEWLGTVPLPPGSRFAVERYTELDEQDTRVPVGWRSIVLRGDPVITASDVTDAAAHLPRRDDPLDSASVSITLTPEAGERLRKFTRQNTKRRMAILVNRIVESAPVIQTEISGGYLQVTMGAGSPREQIEDARRLASALRGRHDRGR